MAVFDFSNYRSPSEARALEAQAFAERQLNAALASKRANTLALAQTAMQSEAQKSLEGYRNDTLDYQRSASAMAAMDRYRSFGLQERQFERTKEIDEASKKLAEEQFLMQKAQIQAQQQSLDSIYNDYENQIKEIESKMGTGSGWWDGVSDSGMEQRRINQINELKAAQQNLVVEGYIPLGLTPGASMQASPQALPQASQPSPVPTSLPRNQAIQSPGRPMLPTMQEAQSIGMQNNGLFDRMGKYQTPAAVPAAQIPQPAITQNDPGWIDRVRQIKASEQAQRQAVSDGFSSSDYFSPSNTYAGSTPPIQVPSSPIGGREIFSLLDRLRAGTGIDVPWDSSTRTLSGADNLESQPQPAQPVQQSNLQMPSRLGNFRRFLPAPPPKEKDVKTALAAMTKLYESQGMPSQEAAAQAFRDARINSDLFNQAVRQ